MIKVRHLMYKYRGAHTLTLRDVSFDVKRGEIVALTGKNGSGKSTLGRLIAGIVIPHKGQIYIDNVDVGMRKNYQQIFAKIGIVFQNPETQIIFNNLEDKMNFALGRQGNTEKIIDEALKQVGIVNRKDDLWNFSLGQKQRVILAEMLARKPKYLVLDEPTTMIDSAGKRKIWKIIRKLRSQGMGILLITNSDQEAAIADRIITLQNGDIKHD